MFPHKRTERSELILMLSTHSALFLLLKQSLNKKKQKNNGFLCSLVPSCTSGADYKYSPHMVSFSSLQAFKVCLFTSRYLWLFAFCPAFFKQSFR